MIAHAIILIATTRAVSPVHGESVKAPICKLQDIPAESAKPVSFFGREYLGKNGELVYVYGE